MAKSGTVMSSNFAPFTAFKNGKASECRLHQKVKQSPAFCRNVHPVMVSAAKPNSPAWQPAWESSRQSFTGWQRRWQHRHHSPPLFNYIVQPNVKRCQDSRRANPVLMNGNRWVRQWTRCWPRTGLAVSETGCQESRESQIERRNTGGRMSADCLQSQYLKWTCAFGCLLI